MFNTAEEIIESCKTMAVGASLEFAFPPGDLFAGDAGLLAQINAERKAAGKEGQVGIQRTGLIITATCVKGE